MGNAYLLSRPISGSGLIQHRIFSYREQCRLWHPRRFKIASICKENLMLKHVCRFLLCVALISISGFSAKNMLFANEAMTSDNDLYKQGLEYLESSRYIKARLAFQSLINAYSNSDLAPLSYIEIGDSFFNEGGLENLAQALKEYENFIRLFPKHSKAPEVRMKIIATNWKLLKAPDRDRQYALSVETEVQNFLKQYPESEFVPIVRQLLQNVQEIINKTKSEQWPPVKPSRLDMVNTVGLCPILRMPREPRT
jgi:outer membrane assembly lipoprotein YfiO